jgi:hypothetical protein
MNKTDKYGYAELLADNLKAARRFYYLILAVVLFLVVTLLENDPARIPAIKQALAVCQRYQQTQNAASGSWNELATIARSKEKDSDRSYAVYQSSFHVTASWANLGDCRPAEENKDEPIRNKLIRAWNYLEFLNRDGAVITSMTTDTGATDVILPTEHPSFTIETAFLHCFSALSNDILKRTHLTVMATAMAGGAYDAKYLSAVGSVANRANDPDAEMVEVLKSSPTFAKIAFVLNAQKLSPDYFKGLQGQYAGLRSSLAALGLWDTVTSATYNPSIQFKGGPYSGALMRDAALLNDASLNKAIADLEGEMRVRSKKLRIPLTSYDARMDLAVILTGVILVALQLAYMFTLLNIARLAPHVSKETIGFFPWAVFWNASMERVATADVLPHLRPLVVSLAFVHAFIATGVLAWVAISMLRFGAGLWVEACISVICALLTAALGYLSFSCINSVDTVISHRRRAKAAVQR